MLGTGTSCKTINVLAVLLRSEGVKVKAVDGEKGSEGLPGTAATQLHVPFKAVALQQLANALLVSKKVSTSTAAAAAAAAVIGGVVDAVCAGEARPRAVIIVPWTADSRG